MAGPSFYPPANRTVQWFGDDFPGVRFDRVEKVLLHSTETEGWPGYGGGASAPNLTYRPLAPRGQRWRQHFRIDQSARALRDPSGTVVRENRDRVVQVEICAYTDHDLAARRGHLAIRDLEREHLEDIAAFLAWMRDEWGVPLVTPAVWLPWDDSYGLDTDARMPGPEYDAFRGVLGHMHASGNTHGDPAGLDIETVMAIAREDDMPTAEEIAATLATHDGYLESLAGVIRHNVWLAPNEAVPGEPSYRTTLTQTREHVLAHTAQLAALTAAIEALAAGTGTSPEELAAIREAADQGASDALERMIDEARVELVAEGAGQ
jgi:hypothetical protein